MRHPLLALCLLALAGSAQAQGPARHDLLAQCPQLAEQLQESLASARQLVDRDGAVQVQMVINERGLLHIESIEGTNRYLGPVRRALRGLECRSALPQRQMLTIRFEDPSVHRPSWSTRALASAPPSPLQP